MQKTNASVCLGRKKRKTRSLYRPVSLLHPHTQYPALSPWTLSTAPLPSTALSHSSPAGTSSRSSRPSAPLSSCFSSLSRTPLSLSSSSAAGPTPDQRRLSASPLSSSSSPPNPSIVSVHLICLSLSRLHPLQPNLQVQVSSQIHRLDHRATGTPHFHQPLLPRLSFPSSLRSSRRSPGIHPESTRSPTGVRREDRV